jgi:6,7-dimethyl-8-ribityllumazine synthase
MPRTIEGELSAKGLRIGIVVSRFNDFITSRLLGGALDALTRSGAEEDDVTVVRVPGARELPLVAQAMARAGDVDAIICLGAIIRGGTPHFDYVAAEASKGIANAAMDAGMPIIFGVLTTDTIEQAVERAGTKAGNRGYDAAISAIEMASLLKKLKID